MLKQLFNKANIVTYIGLILAILGMWLCFTSKVNIAIICLIACGICDGFDGTIACWLRKTDDNGYGIQLDSLVDIISSGILPIIICYSMGFNSVVNTIVYAFFIVMGVTRLAYYNVATSEDHKSFIGVPITTSTIVLPIVYYFSKNEILFMIALLVLGILYVTPIKIKKLSLKEKIVISIIGIVAVIVLMIGGQNG